MKIQIVDASVAIKWFLPEKNSEASLAILKAIENNPTEFAVPELFFNEMLSVFCRLCRSGKEIVDNVHLLEELGLQRIGNGSELLGCAAKLAFDYKLSGYDAIYAACAQLMRGVWITADERAHAKISYMKISRLP